MRPLTQEESVEGSVAPFVGGLLTGLREGVEAALIIGILAGYLVKIGRADRLVSVWVGVVAAVFLSLIAAILIYAAAGGLTGPAELLFEAIATLAAAVVVTWMLFWMRRQATTLGGELRKGIDAAITNAPVTGIALLAFTAVIREGLETAIFLIGQAAAVGQVGGATAVLAGAVVGLALAIAVGISIFRLGARLNLGRFFTWTGSALIVIAAGLLAHGVHELIEIGMLPALMNPVYDLSAYLPDDAGVGLFARAIFGYRAAPELLTLLAQATYLVLGLIFYVRPTRAAAQAISDRVAPAATS